MSPARILFGQIVVVFAITFLFVWAGTEWTAHALGYQPELGAPWRVIHGFALYRPWQLFVWWYFFDAYAPSVFLCGGLIAASGGIVATGAAIVMSLWRARVQTHVTTYGSARWATARDLAHAGVLTANGVVLGRWEPPARSMLGNRSSIIRHVGPDHVLCFAPTRSGKGVGLVIPTLLSWTGAAIIHDIKGENWRITAGWRARVSTCLAFNPTDMASARYNPLLEVRKGAHEVKDVQNIADILVDPEGALEKRNHWEKTAHSLLVGVILHVLYAEPEKTLARVAMLLSDPARSFGSTLHIMMSTNHLGDRRGPKVHPVVASAARELLNKSENERSGVLSTAMSFLGLYRDPVVAHVTAASDFRIADLVGLAKPVSLYLIVPPSDLARTKPLMRLLLNQIGRRLTEGLDPERSTKSRHELLLMLDEFPALGRLDFFESALAFMAGYRVRAFLIAQSLNQIEKAYGTNNAILDNCHIRVAFAANDERTARRLSDALGTATEQRAMRNYAGHRLAPWLAHVMVSRQETARPLLTPGEVMQLPTMDALILIAGVPPIRAKKLRYYENPQFARHVITPPSTLRPPLTTTAVDEWGNSVRTTDPGLAGAWSDSVSEAENESDASKGGMIDLKTQFENEPATIESQDEHLEANLFAPSDDETDDVPNASVVLSTQSAVRRAFGIGRHDVGDLS
jgi:type IV secretion system protein VirD4